jgi:guanosine-3',5'-bis(diphosphate) 3'-pyrophosphohydrolase
VERKVNQIEHSKHISKSAKIVKLADKLSNIGSMCGTKPNGWSEERVRGYALWGYLVCEQMFGVNQDLEEKLRLVF